MTKNTDAERTSARSKGRNEFQHPNGTYVKRYTKTGRTLNAGDTPDKRVRDEK